jgi:O-antigen ligase
LFFVFESLKGQPNQFPTVSKLRSNYVLSLRHTMHTWHRALRQFQLGLLLLAALCMPFGFFQGPLAGFLALSWLADLRWGQKWHDLRRAGWFWAMFLFYGLYALTLLWTVNKDAGSMSMQVKLGMFIYPLVMAGIRLDERQTRRIIAAFLLGLLAAGLYMLGRASLIWINEHRNAFFYQAFTERLVHPGYLAMYYCLGIALLFHTVLLQNAGKRWKIGAAVLCGFFVLILLLLASKLGLVALALLVAGYVVYAIIRFRRWVVGVAALLLLAGGFVAAWNFFPGLRDRVSNLTETLNSKTPIDPTEVESNRVRLLIWSADITIISSNPLGVGAGDVQDALEQEYAIRGMTGAGEKHLNAHSQFFQTTIAAGWVGLFMLLLIVLGPVLWGLRVRYGFAVIFGLLFFINCLPESMLEVQAGTLFFGFFYSLFLLSASRNCLTPLKAPPLAWPL